MFYDAGRSGQRSPKGKELAEDHGLCAPSSSHSHGILGKGMPWDAGLRSASPSRTATVLGDEGQREAALRPVGIHGDGGGRQVYKAPTRRREHASVETPAAMPGLIMPRLINRRPGQCDGGGPRGPALRPDPGRRLFHLARRNPPGGKPAATGCCRRMSSTMADGFLGQLAFVARPFAAASILLWTDTHCQPAAGSRFGAWRFPPLAGLVPSESVIGLIPMLRASFSPVRRRAVP